MFDGGISSPQFDLTIVRLRPIKIAALPVKRYLAACAATCLLQAASRFKRRLSLPTGKSAGMLGFSGGRR
jgi:hypothetical protein